MAADPVSRETRKRRALPDRVPNQGGTLVFWREVQGWTQKEAAEWYGIGWRAWQRWEAGERAIPLPLVLRILDETHYLVENGRPD